MSKILYISSEAFPLVKTGGLGDVAGSLPNALLKNGQDVRLLLPAYPEVLTKIDKGKVIASSAYYGKPVSIIESRLPGTRVIVWLVACDAAFDRVGGPYADETGQPWPDNAQRFAIFCRAAVDLALGNLQPDRQPGWQPDIVHCNDWQSGLVPALLSLHKKRPATVFTIHNLAYQGNFAAKTFSELQLPETLWSMDGLEFYDQLSFIKGGLVYADKITTVSPHYAREIMLSEFGYGMEGLLNVRAADVSGILNGIDEKHWNPGTDNYLSHKYNRRSLDKKSLNKTALQEELSLPVNNQTPMIGMVSRLVEQKGFDIILKSIDEILKYPLQLVILGNGEKHFEDQLTKKAAVYPQQLKVVVGYDESLSHRIEAASDMYLMPSTFEPCGLNQMYSLRYGTLPIVTSVGGLADTVVDANETSISYATANGFVLKDNTSAALAQAIKRAVATYNKTDVWRQLQLNAMQGDFSWQASALQYISLYQQIIRS